MTTIFAKRASAPTPQITFRPPYDALAQGLLPENVPVSTVVADLTSTGGYPTTDPVTISEIADPGNKFTVVGTTLVTSATLDYDVATSHSLTIRAANTAGGNNITIVVTVGDVASGLTVNNQTADFGVHTLDQAGSWSPVVASGTITSATITGGTLGATSADRWPTNVNGWEIEEDGGLKKHRASSGGTDVAAGTLICSYNSGADTATITINALANTYSVASDPELTTWLGLSSTITDGKTCLLRPEGTYTKRNLTKKWTIPTKITGPAVWPPVVLITYKGEFANDYTWQYTNCAFLTVEYIHFENTCDWQISDVGSRIIRFNGSLTPIPTDIVHRYCEFSSNPINPHGAYANDVSPPITVNTIPYTFTLRADGYYRGASVMTFVQPHANITFQGCWFHDMWSFGSIGCQGTLTFTENYVEHGYYDNMSVGYQFNSVATIFARNFVGNMCGSGGDWIPTLNNANTGGGWHDGATPPNYYYNPHADLVQMNLQPTFGDWSGQRFEQNILMIGDTRNNSTHGFFFDIGSAGAVLVDPLYRGNVVVILNGGNHGMTMYRTNNGRWYNNLVVRHEDDPNDGLASEIRINVGGTQLIGTPTFIGNIVGSIAIGNADVGTGVESRNVELHPFGPGTTIPYDNVFTGTDHSRPASIADVFAKFSMKVGGEANKPAWSGKNAGPIGSGYCTFPTNMHLWPTVLMVPDGYSINSAYEVP